MEDIAAAILKVMADRMMCMGVHLGASSKEGYLVARCGVNAAVARALVKKMGTAMYVPTNLR